MKSSEKDRGPAMPGLKAKDLVGLSQEDLQRKLADLKRELLSLRTMKATAGPVPERIARFRVCKKDVARVLTVIHQKARDEARAAFEGAEHIPKTFRPRLTHAMRCQLTEKQKRLLPSKLMKRKLQFPKLKYAVKV